MIACITNVECLQKQYVVQIMSCVARHWNGHVAAASDFFPLTCVAMTDAHDTLKVRCA